MPDIADQYRIIAAGAGGRRQPERGRLQFSGADRVSFRQALVTNDLKPLSAGSGAYAAYLTPNGRMISDLHLYVRENDVVADVPAAIVRDLAARFDQLLFAEDVTVADVSSDLSQLLVVGAQAAGALAAATEIPVARFEALALHSHVALDSSGGFIARSDAAGGLPAFTSLMSVQDELSLTTKLAESGVLAIDEALFEAIRVNAARPEFGLDMDETTIPLEAGLLERAISTSKGCYVGQEIVIRMLHRGGGRVAKRLAQLRSADSDGATPQRGHKLAVDGRDVGEITSVAPSVEGRGWVALGYVHRDAAEIGRVVSTGDGTASIVALA